MMDKKILRTLAGRKVGFTVESFSVVDLFEDPAA
jgi:hypothetical protein